MGFSQAWIAVRGTPPETVLAAFGLRRTGEREDVAEAPLDALHLPGGWFMIIANHEVNAITTISDDGVLARVSTKFDVVCGFVEEHVMDSMLCAWSRGRREWRILHIGEKGLHHLDVEGTPPACFAAIRERCIAAHEREGGDGDEVDHVFDVPVDVGVELIGYRYDMVPDGDEPYDVLGPAPPPAASSPPPRRKRAVRREKPSFWKRLFGG